MTCSESRLLLLAVAAFASACTCGGKPAVGPRLEAVTPAWGFATEETHVALVGEAFTPRAQLHWAGPLSDSENFHVFVGATEVGGVTWADASHLSALVPAGLPLGRHPVRVVDPYGVETSLDDAFEVRERGGASLSGQLATAAQSVLVGRAIVATLSLTNTGDTDARDLAVEPGAPAGTAEAMFVGVAPTVASLAPGETVSVPLTWVTSAVGVVTLSVTVRGLDARSLAVVSLGPLSAAPVNVLPPPFLTATVTVDQPVHLVGDAIGLQVRVTNASMGLVQSLLPTVAASPAGLVTATTVALARDVPGGQTQTFSFTYDAVAAGVVTFTVSGLGVDAATGEPVAMPVVTQDVTLWPRPAVLAATLTAAPAVVNLGQTFAVKLAVDNSGQSAALDVTPSTLTTSGAGAATISTGPTPPVISTLAAGATDAMTWRYTATALGALTFAGTASAIDESSLAPLTAVAAPVSVQVQRPAELTATFSTPLRVNVGQAFSWSLLVNNAGDSTASMVAPSRVGLAGTSLGGAADGGPAPLSQDIPGASSRTFAFGFLAGDAGTLTFNAGAAGTDATDGLMVAAPVATSPLIQVDEPARLEGTLVADGCSVDGGITLTMTVTNPGGAAAVNVTPSSIAVTGAGSLLTGPSPASATVSGGGVATFSWTFAGSGSLLFQGSATGTDGNDGTTLSTGPLGTVPAQVSLDRVCRVALDPFGDGTAFSYVFSYAGQVWLGPRRDGTGAISMNPDGTVPASHGFSFPRDPGTGAGSSNTAPAPYPSIGAAGCLANTPACGPDNENARGLFFSGTVAGVEWLGIAGSGVSVKHVYFTSDRGPALQFRFVDFTAGTANSNGVQSARVFRDQVYLGTLERNNSRPQLLGLTTMPPSPGLDAVVSTAAGPGVDLINFGAEQMPGLGRSGGNPAPNVLVDTITDFNDRIYLANNGGWMLSTTNAPRGYTVASGDWAIATPSQVAYGAKTSVTTAKAGDLLPSDRAVPAMVAYRGRLYAARNTTVGPQLWGCTPAGVRCDPASWTLVAPNSVGDGQLSQFNVGGNSSIGLLAATPTTLFIGFNNPSGVAIYKTTAAAPSTRADFTGTGGCSGSTPSCQGLGGSGLGEGAQNNQFFDSRALTFAGRDWLYFVTGDGANGVRVWRTSD